MKTVVNKECGFVKILKPGNTNLQSLTNNWDGEVK